MGMFTWVNPAAKILPAEFRGLEGWQTKDVVECQLETLEITEDGQLIHIWHEYEVREDDEALFGFYMVPTKEHRDILGYHGDMRICTSVDDVNGPGYKFIDLRARFADGRLQWVREIVEGGKGK